MRIQITINTEDEQAIPSILRDVASQLDDPATQDKERMDGSLTLENEQYQAHVQPYFDGGMYVVAWCDRGGKDYYSRHESWDEAEAEYRNITRYPQNPKYEDRLYSASMCYEIKTTD